MAQDSLSVQNGTGAAVRQAINTAMQASATNQSGSSAPSTTYPFQFFADTNSNTLKIRNAANDAYINVSAVGQIGAANLGLLPAAGGTISGNLIVSGNLTVNGSTTTIDSTTLTVEDKNIELGKVSSPSDTTADGGGITLLGSTNHTFNWINSTDSWTSSEHIALPDNKKLQLGDSQDLQIYHNGSNSFIQDQGTGNLFIDFGTSINLRKYEGGGVAMETVLKGTVDGAVELYHDNSKKFETSNSGVSITGSIDVNGLSNTSPITSITTSDFIGKFESSDSIGRLIIEDSNSTNNANGLQINGDTIMLICNNETGLQCIGNGAVELFHDNTKKAETSATGFDVTGAITATGDLTIDTNTLHVDSSNNRVGIGTSSPDKEFHVERNDNSTTAIAKFKNAGTGDATLQIGTAATNFVIGMDNSDSDKFKFGFGDALQSITGLTIDSSGNVGLGVTTISDARFRIKGANNNTSAFNDGLMVTSNNETVYKKYSWAGIETKGGLSFHEASSGSVVETIRIDSSGRLLLGTTTEGVSTADDLTIATSGSTGITIRSASANAGNIAFSDGTSGDDEIRGLIQYHHNDNAMKIFTDASERIRILSDGAVCINATTRPVVGTEFLGVQGGSASSSVGIAATVSHNEGIPFFASNSSNSFADRLMRFAAGSGGDIRGTIIFNGSAMVYGGTSDYRLKENITQITNGITKLKTLNPIKFNWIKDETNTSIMGFLAHEVQAVMPEAVAGEKDAVDSKGKEDYQEMDYGRITPLIVAALQELIGKVEALEAA